MRSPDRPSSRLSLTIIAPLVEVVQVEVAMRIATGDGPVAHAFILVEGQLIGRAVAGGHRCHCRNASVLVRLVVPVDLLGEERLPQRAAAALGSIVQGLRRRLHQDGEEVVGGVHHILSALRPRR